MESHSTLRVVVDSKFKLQKHVWTVTEKARGVMAKLIRSTIRKLQSLWCHSLYFKQGLFLIIG